MVIDCAIIGGGPAGLSAALTLGRARRNVIVFDDNQPRNAVTQETHGFLTRDGVKPAEFRNIAHQEISKYPSVEIRNARITDVSKHENSFELIMDNDEVFQARTIILATGLKETLPDIDGIHDFYGKSLFSCPYCDGWERRDKPLVVISEGPHTFHFVKLVWNWSHNLLVCTNGRQLFTEEQQEMLRRKEIQVVEEHITALVGTNGQLERIAFATQGERRYESGFVATQLSQASPFAVQLGCDLNPPGGPVTDNLGRTTVKGVYAAGEVTAMSSQLILAAAQGSMTAASVNMDLIESEFESM